jgi:type I restriction enzyme M protein
LRKEDIDKIISTFENRTEDKYSHLAPCEVETNDYNLNIPRYVDTFEERRIDLKP